MNAIFYGSDDWKDEQAIWLILWGLYEIVDNRDDILTIIHGGDVDEELYRGVSFLAEKCVKKLNYLTNKQLRADCIHTVEFPLSPGSLGGSAEYIRNQTMINEGKPDIVFVFSESSDPNPVALNMLELCREYKIPSYLIKRYS